MKDRHFAATHPVSGCTIRIPAWALAAYAALGAREGVVVDGVRRTKAQADSIARRELARLGKAAAHARAEQEREREAKLLERMHPNVIAFRKQAG